MLAQERRRHVSDLVGRHFDGTANGQVLASGWVVNLHDHLPLLSDPARPVQHLKDDPLGVGVLLPDLAELGLLLGEALDDLLRVGLRLCPQKGRSNQCECGQQNASFHFSRLDAVRAERSLIVGNS